MAFRAPNQDFWEEVIVASLRTKLAHALICASLLPWIIGVQTASSARPLESHSLRIQADSFRSSTLAAPDPALAWNTFLGGIGDEEGDDIVVDRSGNIYVTGYSYVSWGSPIRNLSTMPDAFVAKLGPNGNLIWNTFLGGSGGDAGYGIAVDASGNVYVTGNSDLTWGNPIRAYTPGIADAFLARLDTHGNLIWNTFLGGTGTDESREIAVDGGTVYVTGRSDVAWGTVTIRAYEGSMDAFVARLDTNGNFVWNSFLGGSEFDEAYGIVTDGTGATFVTGFSTGRPGITGSWGNPVRAYTAFRDAFVAKLDGGGGLVWNTFLGGGGNDEGSNLAVDGNGNTYVTGSSMTTWENPIRRFTANEDAFVAKVGVSGNLLWSTFLGGERSDLAMGIDIDGSGNTYVAGYSTAGWGNPIRAYTAGIDAFAVKIDPGGGLTWNTFLGSSTTDYAYNIDVDMTGNAYVIGHGIATWGNPVRPYTAEMDSFVARLDFPPLVTSTSLEPVMNPGPGSFTVTFSEDLNNPPGSSNTDDATNPRNYLLIDKGANGISDTTSCTSGLTSDDQRITVTNVTYNSISFTSTVSLSGALPAGKYRLLVCGTTSIVDLASTALAGNGITSGTDFTFDFTVNTAPSNVPGDVVSLPRTGFAPHIVTSLPSQPADKEYASLGDLWLEIPSQGLKTSIVGVPQSDLRWDVAWLGKDIGWLHGTAFPSWEGNSVLTGHVYDANGLPGPFYNLKNLRYGDSIVIHLYGEKYIFQVQATRLVSPASTDFALEHLEDYSYLTLITCQGYNPLNDSYLFRRIIRAILVDVQSE